MPDRPNDPTAPPANFSHFEVDYNSGTSWQSWLSNTTANNATFIGSDQAQISFRVRAVTQLGTPGTWAETTVGTAVSAVTKYYYHGASRVAMRQGSEVSYLHGDHLGSTSLTTNSTGTLIHEARYLPFGGERWNSGVGATDFTYTGQRVEVGFGLHDYNARYLSLIHI